ncbi:MAG TPA: FtsX-like permease family protein [Mycobacteriales bacterium]
MLRTSWKGLLGHKFRFVATALAVTLGVAFMAGTLVLTDTIRSTFDNLFADVYQGTDAVIRGKASFEGPPGAGVQRGRIDAAVVDTVRRVDGVAAAEGDVSGYARLVGKDGQALGNPATGAPTIGMSWTENRALNTFTLVSGTAPGRDDEVVIDRKSARDGDLEVGDTTTVVVGRPMRVRIAGIARFGKADSPGGATIVAFPRQAAQRLIGEPGKYDSVSVLAAGGVSETELVRRLSAVLPPGTEALTGAAITAETQSEMAKAFRFFNTFMLIFAVIALLVGGFMIFNTFSITVAQRTRENGLLRALGASRRQVLGSVLLEALAVGVLAALLGIAAGFAVALGLKGLLAGVGLDIPTGSVVFTSTTAIISFTVGVGITVLAALSPARKAAKVPPVAAMQEGATGSTGYGSRQRMVVGAAVLGLGLAALLIGLFRDVEQPVVIVGAGALLVFFGVSILGRTISLPLSRVLGAPLPRLRGVTGALARENAMRNPKRTAASASALMIGVGVVGLITIFVSSTKASMDAAVDRAFTGDIVVDSGGGMFGGVDPGLAARLRALPEVDTAAGLRQGVAQVAGSAVMVQATDPRAAVELMKVGPVAGSPADLGRDAIGLHEDVAARKGLRLGDPVPVAFKDSGTRSLRLALIYGENRQAGNYLLGTEAYEANFATRMDSKVLVKRAAGTSPEAALAAVKQVGQAYPGAKVLDRAQFKAEQTKPLNQLLALVYALLGLAILIALLGIANTLALSIVERTRELGLLRAVGMTRSQLRSTIRWESVVIAVQGTVLGLLIGLFFGWALVTALADEGITVFRVPYASLAVVVVLAALAGMVAAVPPSRRAAKLDVLRAVVTE